MDERTKAYRRWQALRNVTTERGASPNEAATAARLAGEIDARWKFSASPDVIRGMGQDLYERFAAHGATGVAYAESVGVTLPPEIQAFAEMLAWMIANGRAR